MFWCGGFEDLLIAAAGSSRELLNLDHAGIMDKARTLRNDAKLGFGTLAALCRRAAGPLAVSWDALD
jgi:hypothetical protein